MKARFGLALLMCAPLLLAATGASAAADRTYDCSKAGNANKAACKGAASAAKAPAATPAKPPMAPPAKPMAAATPAKPAKPMNYDCSKAGNANKAACKGAAPAAMAKSPMAPPVAAAKAPPAKPMAAVAPVARPAPPATPRPAVAASASAMGRPAVAQGQPGRTVEWTTKTGKIVHYDCSKAGNANKTACK